MHSGGGLRVVDKSEQEYVNDAFVLDEPRQPRQPQLTELECLVLATVRDYPRGVAPTNQQVIRAIRASRDNVRKNDVNRALHFLAQQRLLYFTATQDNKDKLWWVAQ
jgi:Fe2+ or Zn2+ uptake regulation protein